MDVDVATRTMVGDAMEVDAAVATTDHGRRGPTDIGTVGEDGGRYAGATAGDEMDIDAATGTADHGRRGVTDAVGGGGQAAARKKTKRGKRAGKTKHERRKGGQK